MTVMASSEATDQIWEKWIDEDEKERVCIFQLFFSICTK